MIRQVIHERPAIGVLIGRNGFLDYFGRHLRVLLQNGCDLLTISPSLLEELQKTPGQLTRKLSPDKAAAPSDLSKISYDEKGFRWALNDDAMASDKLAEGIQGFEKAKTGGKSKPLPMYHVILLDDNDHSHEYVIAMMKSIFGYPEHEGMRLANEVDTQKRAIVLTTHRERAELKRDQIHAYGADFRVATCRGSMSCVIVPAD